MLQKKFNITLIKCLLFFYFVIDCRAQIVPYYPIEIFFNPCGYTNTIPGCKPNLYTTFSSLKVVLSKDLPSTQRLANTISFVGNTELYHNITKSRDYTPFSLNPVLRTHFFANDVFTPCLEINGNIEVLPGLDLNRNIFKYTNYRLRIRPFHYLIVTPNLILQQIFTYGISYNTDKTAMLNVDNKLEKVSRDYNILRYEAIAIYLTPFQTRVFLAPYCFQNQYDDIALSTDGKIDLEQQNLRELGFGCALGLRYKTFTWGYTEGVIEAEKNIDVSNDANTYTKLKFSTKWENQYFTERFGYLLGFDIMYHFFEHEVYNFVIGTIEDMELGRLEIRGDIMPIININRNVSLRPEFDLFYKDIPGKNDIKKFRYWLHVHVMF